MEEPSLLFRVVHLRVKVLDGDLEAIRVTGLIDFDLIQKMLSKVFKCNIIGRNEEGEG